MTIVESERPFDRVPVLARVGDDLLAVWESRTAGCDWGEIDIVSQRFDLSGRPTTDVQTVHACGQSCMNPVLVDRGGGEMWLLHSRHGTELEEFTCIRDGVRDWVDVYVQTSSDHGRTWSDPVPVEFDEVSGCTWLAPCPGAGVTCGSRSEIAIVRVDEAVPDLDCSWSIPKRIRYVGERYYAQILTADEPTKWTQERSLFPGSNETTLARDVDGGTVMAIRTALKKRVRWFSAHWGTWESSLPCPGNNAGLAIDRDHWWFANTASKGRRHRLTLYKSDTRGAHWSKVRVLNEGHSGYCSLVDLGDSIAALYEVDGYRRMRLEVIAK